MTNGLCLRGVDVLTAREDGATESDDSALLDRAGIVERVLVTFDDDLLAEASYHQRESAEFAGIIYAHPLRINIAACITNLELIAKAAEPGELANRVE